MKTYICDACGIVTDKPYEMKMKEFYAGCSFELAGVFPVATK